MHISRAISPYLGYTLLPPPPGVGVAAGGRNIARGVTDTPQRPPAVRVVEGEILTGRSGAAEDNLARSVHTLRGAIDADAREQAGGNATARRAINAYLENSLSHAGSGSARAFRIDVMA